MNILYDQHYHFLDSCHDRREGWDKSTIKQ